MELFEFHANRVWHDEVALCISFADKIEEHEHYFTIQRFEELPGEPLPDVKNVYIELDDQCWGGYGGIKRVTLERSAFTLLVGSRMVPYLRGHDGVRIAFDMDDAEFDVIRRVLQTLLQGYEWLLQLPASPGDVGFK